MAIVSTISFSETSKGWTSFWDYEPTFCFSINGRYFTAVDGSIYEHYVGTTYGNFYGTQYDSEVTVILNENPSMQKNFKTINYEGSNGWEVSVVQSGETFPVKNSASWSSSNDEGKPIPSYAEGKYIHRGVVYRAGFDIKENKYYANIKGDNVILKEGEVFSNEKTSGIKGFFSTVTIKTDETTDIGGAKQLFALSSEYVQSS